MYGKDHHCFNALLRHHLEVLEKYGDVKDFHDFFIKNFYDFFITRNVILDWTNVHTFAIDNCTALKAVLVAISSFKKLEEVLQVQLDIPFELDSDVLSFLQSKLQLKKPLYVQELVTILWRAAKWISKMIVKMLGRSVTEDKSFKDQDFPLAWSTNGTSHDQDDRTGKTIDQVEAHDTIDTNDGTEKTLDTVTRTDRAEKTLEIVNTNDRTRETDVTASADYRSDEILDQITARKAVTFSKSETLSGNEKYISLSAMTDSEKSNQHHIVDILIKELWIQIPLCYTPNNDLLHPMPSYSLILNMMMSNWQRFRLLKSFFEVGCNMFEPDVNGNNLLHILITTISVQSMVELSSAEQLLLLILKNGGACFLHERSKNQKTSLDLLRESHFVQHMPEVQKILECYPDNCYVISLQCLCAIEIKRSLVKCHNLPKSIVQFINNHSHLVK